MQNILDSIPSDIEGKELAYGNNVGKGQYGTVFVGKCRGIEVAIKKLKMQELEKETLEDFKKEVAILRAVRHPNLVLFLGACTQGGELAIVTEFIPGDNLQNMLRNPKISLTLLLRLKMAKEAALGINWLHCSNPAIIHRDIKPANMLVDLNSHVKVCDFGFATVKQKGRKIENPDGAPGSPIWMGPEVLMGDPVDEKSDVYSFGIVLWEVLTRKAPFSTHTKLEAFMKAIVQKRERPEIPPETIPSLKSLIQDCWAHDPVKRPSFAEILTRLDSCIIQTSIQDPVGQQFWKDAHFIGKYEIPGDEFASAFFKFLKLPDPPKDFRNVNSDKRLFVLLLMLANSQTIIEQPPIVTLENFGKFLAWFGPMNENILNNLHDLCIKRWFHGMVNKVQVSMYLEKYPKSFLIRISESLEGYFALSRLEKEPIHTRIFYDQAKGNYQIEYDNHVKNFPSLDSLVVAMTKEWNLTIPTSIDGNLINKLLEHINMAGSYAPSQKLGNNK